MTKKKKSHIPVRLNILFSVIVFLFGALAVKLFDLQVININKYDALLNRTKNVQIKTDSTRGQIYDSKGKLLVGNQSYTAIQYTRQQSNPEEMVNIARRLANILTVSTEEVTERDLKDYWAVTHTKEMNERLDSKEKQLKGSQLYDVQLSKITNEDIQYSAEEKEVIAIFTKMNSVSVYGTVFIKNRDVSSTEVAQITEQQQVLAGVSIGSDWERVYPQGELLRSLLGSVSTQKTGIPLSDANAYLARDYANNSRVGTSYIEQAYEDVLKGTPKMTSLIFDTKNQLVQSEVSYEGRAGSNVTLTIDIELQKRLEAILTNYLAAGVGGYRGLNDSIYAVVQDVHTGEILAMSGKKYGYNSETNAYTNEIVDDVLGAINTNYNMGSTVKAATVGIGFKHGVISVNNNVLQDSPIQFQDSESISSVFNRYGTMQLSVQEALARSSNIYMVRLAMAIGGRPHFRTNDALTINENTLSVLRKELSAYGLGASTGIDVPIESRGYAPSGNSRIGAIYQSFGQYDLYTPLQLSQYITTLANGGTRYATRLVHDIKQPNATGDNMLEVNVSPKPLNTLDVTPEQLSLIKEGLYDVTHKWYGTEYSTFAKYYPSVSGKTGIAEAFYNGELKMQGQVPVDNRAFVAYAPTDKPRISVTVVIPNLSTDSPGYLGASPAKVARSIFSSYFHQ